tara:strand:- start:136 stop:564 length:429 start_codon:yes stop_codon:yes gene_type:complete
MNLNEQLNQAYNAGRRQGLNEQGMMSNMNATSVPQTGGGLGGGGNQYPSMMSNNSGTAVPNYRSGQPPTNLYPNFVGPIDPSQGIYGDDSYGPEIRDLEDRIADILETNPVDPFSFLNDLFDRYGNFRGLNVFGYPLIKGDY